MLCFDINRDSVVSISCCLFNNNMLKFSDDVIKITYNLNLIGRLKRRILVEICNFPHEVLLSSLSSGRRLEAKTGTRRRDIKERCIYYMAL